MTDPVKIKELECCINRAADNYSLPDSELVSRINALTGGSWTAQEISQFCCEYWSHHSLEETAAALLNQGEYPEKEETELCFWKEKSAISLSEEETTLAFCMGKSRKLAEKLEPLPVEEIISWTAGYFQELALLQEEEYCVKEGMQFFTFIPKQQQNYGHSVNLLLTFYQGCFLQAACENIPEDKRKEMTAFMRQMGCRCHCRE